MLNFYCKATINLGTKDSYPRGGILTRDFRNNWTCRARKIDGCKGYLWRYDRQIQERAGQKHYHQAWVR